jgi:hypothetical protein
MIPKIDPTAAPINVFKVARRIRISKTMMQIAINAPAAAEIHGSSPTGTSLYPAATKIAVNISRIRTTSARIMKAYYHANIRIVTEILGVFVALAAQFQVRLNGRHA